jgi:glucosylceramidase
VRLRKHCAGPVEPVHVGSHRAAVILVWITTADRRRLLAPEADVVLGAATAAPATIEIDTARRYQAMIGFGAAITDASAWLIRSRMNGAQRAALMRELFGPAPHADLFRPTDQRILVPSLQPR